MRSLLRMCILIVKAEVLYFLGLELLLLGLGLEKGLGVGLGLVTLVLGFGIGVGLESIDPYRPPKKLFWEPSVSTSQQATNESDFAN